jgi:CHAT domain-containing protein
MVALPHTPGHADLAAAHSEGIAIIGTRSSLPPLVGPEATHRNVLDALPQCGWAHFACHAHNDTSTPSTSHLLLHDQPLMITDLNRMRLPTAELAYLSACSTARTSVALAGEAIHWARRSNSPAFPT